MAASGRRHSSSTHQRHDLPAPGPRSRPYGERVHLLPAVELEVKHPVFGYRLSYRRVLDVQVRLLAAHLMAEVPNYAAFTTR